MNNYVLDASVLIQYVVNEPHTLNITTLLNEAGKTVSLYTLEYCILECSGVLWKHVRFNQVPQAKAEILIEDLLALDINLMPMTSLIPRALAIGLQRQLAVYDAVYIALAEKLRCPLITDDLRQKQAALSIGVVCQPITVFQP